jgi:hypothetical protein
MKFLENKISEKESLMHLLGEPMQFFKNLLPVFFKVVISSGIICTLLLGFTAKPTFAQLTDLKSEISRVQIPNSPIPGKTVSGEKTPQEIRITAKVGSFPQEPVGSLSKIWSTQ